VHSRPPRGKKSATFKSHAGLCPTVSCGQTFQLVEKEGKNADEGLLKRVEVHHLPHLPPQFIENLHGGGVVFHNPREKRSVVPHWKIEGTKSSVFRRLKGRNEKKKY